MDRPDGPLEHLHVRRHNLSLVLRLLDTQGPRSRADLAKATGLTRATLSSLVADLIDRGLVREIGRGVDQRVGRPATLLEVDGGHVVTVGVELNVAYTSVRANDLSGATLYERRRPIPDASTDVDELVPVLVHELTRAIKAVEEGDRRVVGVTIAVPGIVNANTGVVILAPNLGWRNVPLLALLDAELGSRVPLAMDNEANLGAIAEYRVGHIAGTEHLAYLFVSTGVGGGIIVGGSLLRGASGAAGEIGHMTVDEHGAPCACGARGCLETVLGLQSLLRAAVPDAAEELLANHHLSIEARVAAVAARAQAKEPAVLDGLRRVGHQLGMGIANLVDVLNPECVVLGGLVVDLAPWLMPSALRAFQAHALSDSAQHCRIELSTLGYSASGLGGALFAAERIFADPTLVPARRALLSHDS
jgi:predicted NBD/HSP70 family sugar kinase